jgi:hypothetical protein
VPARFAITRDVAQKMRRRCAEDEDEHRRRIGAIAGQLGLRPNSLAQGLHRRRGCTTGLLSNDS